VLRGLAEMGYATYDQLARHAFSPASYTHVTETVAPLIAWGLVTYDFEKRGAEIGRSKRIFTCTKRGRSYCAREVPEEFLPVTTKRHDVTFQEHRRGVADLIIAARRFAAAHPNRAGVARIQTDLVTNRAPITVPLDGGTVRLIPDLWAELLIDGVRRPFAFEYDRGTERNTKGEKQWREKIRKYVCALRGPLQEHFDVRGCLVVVVVDPPDAAWATRRLRTLLDWTEQELTALFPREAAATKWGQLFRFAVTNPEHSSPGAFFTAPWWVCPFDPQPRSLIALESGSSAAR
jgi:hypothetical protein